MEADARASKYPILDELEVPQNVLQTWQATVDLLAQIAHIPAALVMRVHADEIEVAVSSHSPGNVYEPGERAPLAGDLYCETVMDTQRELLVPDARKDPRFAKSPDIPLGMISYLSLPLTWPTGDVFGTICILDTQENAYSPLIRALIERLRDSIQLQLAAVYEASQERRVAAEALLDSQSRLRRLIESAPIPLCHVTRGGVISYVNERFVRLFGYTRDEIPTFDDWWPRAYPDPSYRAWVRETWDRALADSIVEGRDITPAEYQVTCNSGDVRTMEISGIALGEDFLATFVDLTERLRAEQAVRDERSTLHGIVESVPAIVFSLDREYRYTSFNTAHADTMRAIFGAEIELGHSMLDYHTVPEDREIARHNLDRALAGEQVIVEAASGDEQLERGYFRISHSPIRSGDEVVGVAVLVEDVTERHEAEIQLQRLNRELRAVSLCNQALIRADDEDTLLAEVCQIICEEAGYRMAWVGYAENDAGRSVRPVASAGVETDYLADASITWADEPRGRGPTGTAIRTGMTVCAQDYATDPRLGPWRESALARGYRSAIALPLKDAGGVPFGALSIYASEPGVFTGDEVRLLEELSADLAYGIVVLRARSERAEADRALRESEEQYRRFVEDDPVAVFITTPDGRVATCNPAYVRMLGFASAEAALATSITSVYADRAEREPLITRVREQGRVDHRELVWRQVDGTPVTVDASAVGEFDEAGRLIGIRGYAIDLTERRRLEAQLRQAQKMEAIGQLAGGIAHDFNNMLTAICANAEILASEIPIEDPRSREVAEIREAGARAAALTRQLLAFGRQTVLQLTILDPATVVDGVVAMMGRLLGERIDLVTRHSPDPVRIRADRGQLEQVLVNLAVNARDAMPDGGVLTIETRATTAILPGAHGEPEVVRPAVSIVVADTGTGMDEATRARAFEPFFTTKEPGRGTGMGLAMVYGIVQQSGGVVSIASEPGAGTRVTIDLPRVGEGADAHDDPAAPASTGPGDRDDPDAGQGPPGQA